MLIALALLLLALILVLVKDREFWFPPAPATVIRIGAGGTDPAPEAQTQGQPQATSTSAKSSVPDAAQSQASYSAAGGRRSQSRTRFGAGSHQPAVLPPLEVEVVAGDEHRTIQPGTNSVQVDLQPRAPFSAPHLLVSTSDSGRPVSPMPPDGFISPPAPRRSFPPG